MALTATEALINVAALAYLAAVKANDDLLAAGAVVHWVPADRGDSSANPDMRSTTSAAVITTNTQRVVTEHINDGDFIIALPTSTGPITPLVWFVTNQANDLT